jgi:hypothetical protein
MLPTMTVTTRHVDQKRRVVLPEDVEPDSDVIIEQVDKDSWLVTRHRKQSKLAVVYIPVLEKLPDDPQWDKAERAFARAGRKSLKKLPPPDFD